MPSSTSLSERYDAKERLIGPDAMRHHERIIMLSVLDQHWKDHLLGMDHLREGIGLRGYGQHDPLVEYKRESFDMFEAMMERFQEETVRYLYLMQVIEAPQPAPQRVLPDDGDGGALAAVGTGARRLRAGNDLHRRDGRGLPAPQETRTGTGAHGRIGRSGPGAAGRSPGDKVGRNDPCPCGSGKKYKKCCGA